MHYIDLIVSLLALTLLEIILGIDNLVFLSILVEKLPKNQQKRGRLWGLTFAWVTRLILLAFAFWLVKLQTPLIVWKDLSVSGRDLFLFFGGGFLIVKATQEIHNDLGPKLSTEKIKITKLKRTSFQAIIFQIALMDIIFSLDSVLTAVGLTNHFIVMAIAITCAILVMMYLSGPVSLFINKHPTIKMLALSFLILIGMVLIADSFAFHIPRAYIYFAMGFSLGVEMLNLLRQARNKNE